MATTPPKPPPNTPTHCTAEAATHERECLNAFRRLLSLCVTLLGVDPPTVRSLRGKLAEVMSWTKSDWELIWSQSRELDINDYAQLCYCLDEFKQFDRLDLSAEILKTQHEALQNGLLRKSQNKALNPDFTPMGNVILLCASVGVFAIRHPLTDIKNLRLQNSSIHYSMADFTLDLNKSPLYAEGITTEEAEKHLSDSLLICSAADDGIEIIWENDNPRPKVRITSNEILDAVSVPGRHTRTLNKYQSPGAIYHDLLNASILHNQPLTAAIQRIREALDQELNMMKAKGDKGQHYWMEVMYRQFLGFFRIYRVGESVLPAAEDTGTIEATLSGISPQDRGFLLRFASCDVNNLSLFSAVTFEDIQHLHRRGAIFLRNHGETETSELNANISMLLERNDAYELH
ncbi:hypothetical protein EMCG_08671 [[Emmonsia] crescens]|uniref:Uncharacterized protein n=1 Tax=[Emmonsia] crescens TaxID=73230 RepID=A0A0G2J427_9EURO|nr:hypothetical protein EMCG_08671 [Emmonsia crescens UAMH 3008]